MKVGFTGTRKGLTDPQAESLRRVMARLHMLEFHHGDCVGADDAAANIAEELGIYVESHPPVDEKLRAWNKASLPVHPPKTHFARNRDIVNLTDLLIVCPCEATPQPFGGTWYTHDYAKKQNKRRIIVWPAGDVFDSAGVAEVSR